MTRYAKATDRNQAEIVKALRKLGVFVWPTHTMGNGFPDLLAVVRQQAILLEVKDPAQPPSKRKLTPQEAEFFRAYPGPIFVVTTVEQALEALGMASKKPTRRTETGQGATKGVNPLPGHRSAQ